MATLRINRQTNQVQIGDRTLRVVVEKKDAPSGGEEPRVESARPWWRVYAEARNHFCAETQAGRACGHEI